MSERCVFLPQECEHKVLGSIHHILKDVGDVTLDMPVDELLPVDEMDPGVRGMALELSEAFYDTVDDDRGLPETGVRVLNICTMENGESSVYRRCNAALHERNREAVRPWAKYIAALLEALRRCPRYCGVLYRGMRAAWDAKMDKRYAEGKKVYFWGFTSATTKMEVLMSPQFLGPTGDRVLFIIQVWGRVLEWMGCVGEGAEGDGVCGMKAGRHAAHVRSVVGDGMLVYGDITCHTSGSVWRILAVCSTLQCAPAMM